MLRVENLNMWRLPTRTLPYNNNNHNNHFIYRRLDTVTTVTQIEVDSRQVYVIAIDALLLVYFDWMHLEWGFNFKLVS